jgi:hypothetical protein
MKVIAIAPVLSEHEKSLAYIQCMLYKLLRHQTDYVKASFWIGVAAVQGYSVPEEVRDAILSAYFVRPNIDKLLFALDNWTKNV